MMRLARFTAALAVLVLAVVWPSGAYAAPSDSSAPSEPSGSASPTTSASPSPTGPPPLCQNAPAPNLAVENPPWTQPTFDVPERIAPYSTGKGITVAVLDSGVDAQHPQLAGKVLPGFDFVRGIAEANGDCAPSGTGMAGIIAASQLNGVGFFGIAPDVTILPVRIAETSAPGMPDTTKVSPNTLAAGITYAVQQGADVILTGIVFYAGGGTELQNAVAAAADAGVIIVAGAGDEHPTDARASHPTPAELMPYPASYEHVIGVGAVDSQRVKLPQSSIGPFVDLVAPGGDLLSSGVQGQAAYAGSSYAAAFVAGTVALLLGAHQPVLPPGLSGLAKTDAVIKQIVSTASPSPGDGVEKGYGAGFVDPYRALTEKFTGGGVAEPTTYAAPTLDPQTAAQLASDRAVADGAQRWAWISVGLLALIAIGAATAWRGRRRRWRIGVVTTSELVESEPDPEFVSGEELFAPKKLD